MSKDTTFSYNYSAKENKEVQEIRKKYLPQSENKLEELKRLDRCVQTSGSLESLCAGIGGLLIFRLINRWKELCDLTKLKYFTKDFQTTVLYDATIIKK